MGVGASARSDAGFRLLERDRELALIDDVLASPRGGGGRNLQLTGAAGIGKTRLLSVLTDRAEAASFLTLRATCIPLEREFSFGVAVSLFDRHIREGTSKQRNLLLTGAAARARPIFESGPGGASEAQLFPLLHGLYWLTANVASDTPLLLAVDDAQWADVSSLRYLNFLAQRIEELPIVLAVSFRPGEAESERAELLESMLAVGAADQLKPEALSPAAVGELVRNELPDSPRTFCAACAEATGGNPFLLRELIDELRAEGVAPSEEAAERITRLAPSSLRRAVLLRLGQLHDSAIALAKAVAVLGRGAELRHAAELAALDLEEAGQAADALAENGILELSDGVGFVHPLIGSAVYAELGAAERGRLHRRSAARLTVEGARAERIAAHLLPATREADPEVVATLREAAADALLRGSPGPAVAYLDRALREPPLNRAEVLLELGGAQLLAGLGAEAIVTHAEALEEASGDAQVARAHHALGHARYAAGELTAAAANFSAGADAAADDPDLALRIQADLISIGILVPELHAQIAPILPEAIDRAREGEASGAGRAILASSALLSVLTVDPVARALDMAEEALDGGRLVADEGADGTTIYSITAVLAFAGEFSRNVEVLDRVIEDAIESGSVMGYATAIYSRSYSQLERGRLMEAIADARAAIDARRFGWRQFLPVAYSIQIRALLERGELDEARTVLAETAEEDWEADLPWSTMLWARGEVNLATGDPASALADFRAWGEAWPVPNPAFLAEWRSHAATAAAVLGDREQAIELASEELALAERFGAARSRGVALRALGLAHRGEEGIETLRAAVKALADSEAVLELCRTRVDLGAMLRREGRRSDAREELKRGLDLAQRLGAVALSLRATDELKLAGARPSSRSLSGADSLSAGELRVAAMAAEGMTNREIAQALFVTPKAVQWHLTNTYRKLEISSRDQIADKLNVSGSA